MGTILFCQLTEGEEFIDRQGYVWKKESGLRRVNATLVDSKGVTLPRHHFFSATTQVSRIGDGSDEN